MNDQNPFSSDYPIEGSTEAKTEVPEKKKDVPVEPEFDQGQYEVSKPKRIIIKAKIL